MTAGPGEPLIPCNVSAHRPQPLSGYCVASCYFVGNFHELYQEGFQDADDFQKVLYEYLLINYSFDLMVDKLESFYLNFILQYDIYCQGCCTMPPYRKVEIARGWY